MALAHKLFTSLQNYNNPATRIGELNRIWYDGVNNIFRIQLDTTTPGGSVIGSTIPSLTVSGNSTFNGTVNTLTNANLIGTGQNFLLYSNQIGNNQYGFNGTASVVLNSATDPLGGTTATTITAASDMLWGGNNVRQIFTSLANTQYTFSCYLKLGTATTVSVGMRDNTTGNLPTTAFTTAGIWQRVSVTMTTGASTTNPAIMLGSANGTFYAWGAQVNFGATAGTFIATTDAPIAGYPAINFSGSASIKMDASGNLLIAPGGSGTVQIGNTAGNYVQISNATTGNTPIISLQGVDATRSLQITSKGTSFVYLQNNNAAVTHFSAGGTSAAVNYLNSRGYPTGSAPTLEAVGSDSTMDLGLQAKNGAILIRNPSTQNLIGYSNTFSNGNWSKGTAVTVATTVATTDPFGGSNAWLLLADNTNNTHSMYYIGNNPWVISAVNTLSIYVKTAGYTLVQLSDIGSAVFCARFDLSAVTATPVVGCTATISLVTNGWYRLTLTTLSTVVLVAGSRFSIIGYPSSGASVNTYNVAYQGDATNGIYIYGAQAELATSVGTYVETVSLTQIYTAPKISFNGESSIGLQSDGSLYFSPAGTGALQAQATTAGSTVGGNARGQNAVDLQTQRDTAIKVASGQSAVITGGAHNVASGSSSFIGGGAYNSAGGESSIIAGGSVNSAQGKSALILGGTNNNSNGVYNVIVGGFQNTGTANAAVTTQSATMNGTTAVTLAATNSSIKIGQLVLGTSIGYYDTFVSAISGVNLTLSKAATGSSTSTLSFYTPSGVVVGGSNNTASGSYSFVGGGGDGGLSTNGNTASGDWSVVAGGKKNTASGIASFVGGGGIYDAALTVGPNIASGTSSLIVGGSSNTVTANYGMILGGRGNYVDAGMGAVIGGAYGSTRGITGNTVFPGNYAALGNYSVTAVQAALLVIAKQTTDATPIVLTSDGGSGVSSNQVYLQSNSAYYFKGSVIAGVTGGGNTKAWTFEGAIKKGAANSIALVGTPTVTSSFADAGASSWSIALTANTTTDTLTVTVTGQAATTIRWVCKIETTEMNF
jgi:hypothetical protein